MNNAPKRFVLLLKNKEIMRMILLKPYNDMGEYQLANNDNHKGILRLI